MSRIWEAHTVVAKMTDVGIRRIGPRRGLFLNELLSPKPGVRIQFLFDLVSYCDVRAQSNPFINERDKRVLVERAMVRTLWRSKIEWVQGW